MRDLSQECKVGLTLKNRLPEQTTLAEGRTTVPPAPRQEQLPSAKRKRPGAGGLLPATKPRAHPHHTQGQAEALHWTTPTPNSPTASAACFISARAPSCFSHSHRGRTPARRWEPRGEAGHLQGHGPHNQLDSWLVHLEFLHKVFYPRCEQVPYSGRDGLFNVHSFFSFYL